MSVHFNFEGGMRSRAVGFTSRRKSGHLLLQMHFQEFRDKGTVGGL
jgi:hypothetical protein